MLTFRDKKGVFFEISQQKCNIKAVRPASPKCTSATLCQPAIASIHYQRRDALGNKTPISCSLQSQGNVLFFSDLLQTKNQSAFQHLFQNRFGTRLPTWNGRETPLPNTHKKNINSLSEYISTKIKTQVKGRRHTISPGTLWTSVPYCRTSSRPSRKPSCTSWLAALPQVEPHLFPLDLMQPPHPHPCQQSDHHAVPFQHQSHLWLHHHRSADHLRVTKLPYIPILKDG